MSGATICHNPNCGTSRNDPALVSRPVVVTAAGAALRRPAEMAPGLI